MFKLLTIFLAIGLSSQSALKFTKMVGIDDTCPTPFPNVTASCNGLVTDHMIAIRQCYQLVLINMQFKIQDDRSEPEKVVKDVCDAKVAVDPCLDFIKPDCTGDDLSKVKNYMNACVEWAAQQATGVQLHC